MERGKFSCALEKCRMKLRAKLRRRIGEILLQEEVSSFFIDKSILRIRSGKFFKEDFPKPHIPKQS